ncbi:hypothetical protein GCM10010833_13210 [Blastomonas aquatica]|uniref:Uncharacterized protein n=1 Tax=Blastomonas aquatica TaxID=1510276 RepID=A0ABQ1J4I9_9SPHN|nr:hypothetical protein GCM10010833_13210 [Blastomonas aquatica]
MHLLGSGAAREMIEIYRKITSLLLGGRSFPADNALRKRKALAALGTPAQTGINLRRAGCTIAQSVLQILFANRVADANNHASLLLQQG